MKLELGNIVKLRGFDDLCIVLEDMIARIYEGEYLGMTNIKGEYDKNLIALGYVGEPEGCKEYDIMAIYSCGINVGLRILLNNEKHNWTWVRDEKKSLYTYDEVNQTILKGDRIFINLLGMEKEEVYDTLIKLDILEPIDKNDMIIGKEYAIVFDRLFGSSEINGIPMIGKYVDKNDFRFYKTVCGCTGSSMPNYCDKRKIYSLKNLK